MVKLGQVENQRGPPLLKLATAIENNNNNLFLRITEYIWLELGTKYQWGYNIQMC